MGNFKQGDWFHNDEGAEVCVQGVMDGGSVRAYDFKPGQVSRSIVPAGLSAEDFAAELAKHKMKPGRMPGMEDRGIGLGYVADDDSIELARVRVPVAGGKSE